MSPMIRCAMCALLFTLGCAEDPPEDADDAETSADIIGGTRTTAYPAVMALFAGDLQSGAGSLCTASLIAPRVLITAAHCVSAEEVGPAADFIVFTGADFNQGSGRTLAVSAVMHDPAFSTAHLNAGHDIGAVILASPLSTPPVAVNRAVDPTKLLGQAVRLVGYGASNGAQQTGAGIKRTTTTTLKGADARLLKLGDSQHGTCQGDSGGPAFMSIGGIQTLVGVTSFGQAGCADGGFDTRIDRYGSFIDAALQRGR